MKQTRGTIHLLSHASLLIEVAGLKILTDPWFFSTAFNDGWELDPKPNLDSILAKLENLDIIWISHEHPDHLHFPTLKWLAEHLECKPNFFFQQNNSSKVFKAIERLGFTEFTSMQHLRRMEVGSGVALACYAHRHLDSSLAVFVNHKLWLLNINDTELNESDTKIIRSEFGEPCVIYNQFSIAGSDGSEASLASDAHDVLSKMQVHHKLLNAKVTVPFASFVRFAREDNLYMNPYANSVHDVVKKFNESELRVCVQSADCAPLEWVDFDQLPCNGDEVTETSLARYSCVSDEPSDKHEYNAVTVADVRDAFIERVSDWRAVTNSLVWKYFAPSTVSFRVDDWGEEVWICDFKLATFERATDESPDFIILSQPLYHAFKFPFGIQTLGVSGRYRLGDKHRASPPAWKKVRILSSLYNAEIYFSVRRIVSLHTLRWVWNRRRGLASQIKQQFIRFG